MFAQLDIIEITLDFVKNLILRQLHAKMDFIINKMKDVPLVMKDVKPVQVPAVVHVSVNTMNLKKLSVLLFVEMEKLFGLKKNVMIQTLVLVMVVTLHANRKEVSSVVANHLSVLVQILNLSNVEMV